MVYTAFDLVYLNELQLVSNMFSFKAAAPQIASAWIEGIQQAQVSKVKIVACVFITFSILAILLPTKM